jgi:hypothetical protein
MNGLVQLVQSDGMSLEKALVLHLTRRVALRGDTGLVHELQGAWPPAEVDHVAVSLWDENAD